MLHVKRLRIPVLAAASICVLAAFFILRGDAAAGWLFDKAVIYFTNQKSSQAKLFARASAFISKDPAIHFRLGRLLKDMGEYEMSLTEFRKAAAGNPPFPQSFLEIGRFYFLDPELVGLEEAVASFSKEIELTQDPYSYHLRGILYAQKLGRIKDAEADFRMETELWESWGAPLNLAWALAEQGKLKEAEEAVRLLEKRKPGTVFGDNGLGVIYLRQGRFRDARKRLETAYEKSRQLTVADYREAYPGNPFEYAEEGITSIRAGIAFNLGVVNEKIGDTEAAIRWYEEVLGMLPRLVHVGIAPGVDSETVAQRLNALKSK